MLSANGGVSVFDGIEIDILRALLRGEGDQVIADAMGVRLHLVANVRAKLRRDLGISTSDQLARLATEYGKALKC
jgi:DNA-binding NarL/FixJ family response regulator